MRARTLLAASGPVYPYPNSMYWYRLIKIPNVFFRPNKNEKNLTVFSLVRLCRGYGLVFRNLSDGRGPVLYSTFIWVYPSGRGFICFNPAMPWSCMNEYLYHGGCSSEIVSRKTAHLVLRLCGWCFLRIHQPHFDRLWSLCPLILSKEFGATFGHPSHLIGIPWGSQHVETKPAYEARASAWAEDFSFRYRLLDWLAIGKISWYLQSKRSTWHGGMKRCIDINN